MVRALLPNTDFGIVEVNVTGRQIVKISAARSIETSDIIYAQSQARIGARNKLWMVKDVRKLRAQAEFEPFGEVQIFVDGKVNIIGRFCSQGISSSC